MKSIYRSLILCLAMLLSVQMVWAQGITTSSMTGTITDTKGESLPGATVVAVHTPSGTRYGTATNAEGRFNLPNMRVGGPYTVEVSYVGFQPKTTNNITLSLGDAFTLNVSLSESGTELGEVVITATKDPVMNGDRTGASTNVSRAQIQALPTISRSINDFTRLTPQSNGNAIGGRSARSNNISIDGSNFNNNFGLGTANLPGGSSQPISLDAIEEISVNIAPYDVRQSGFTGAGVNAVTRSGTNEFSGSVYTFLRNQDYQGTKVGDDELIVTDRDYKQYGVRVGGPIIKNKLFFFLNAEFERETTPGQQRIASSPANPFGSANNVTRPSVADLDRFSQYLRDTYGYETGAYQGYGFENRSNKFLARLDWNITNNHRFTIRYNQVEGYGDSFMSGSSSPITNFASGVGRSDINALHYSNSNYRNNNNVYSLVGELNSSFSNKFSNTFRASYTQIKNFRSSEGPIFPFVDILKDGQPYTSFGYELFSFGNKVDDKTLTITNNFTYYAGNHTLTAGVHYEDFRIANGFQRMGTSYYRFASWEDFVGGANPLAFGLTYSLRPGFEQAIPEGRFSQLGIYVQDEYAVMDNLKITGGLRVDLPFYPIDLLENPAVSQLTFAGGQKLNTATLPKSTPLYSPRLGFNWDVKGDRSLQLRGGTGIFSGRIPFVWLVNQSGDSGMLQITDAREGAQVPGPFNPDPNFYRPATPPAAGTSVPSVISATSDNFKMPQVWKSNLAIDKLLPGGIVATIEGIYSKDLNNAVFTNANLTQPQANLAAGTAYPDHRPIYPNGNARFINRTASGGALNAIVLDNNQEGYYWSATAQLQKTFANGLSALVAYTRSQAENTYDGSGDQSLSSWNLTTAVNGANNPELGYANYVIPNRVIASLAYKKEYAKHFATTLSMVYDGSEQGRFSYIYSSDFNRDGANADLIYIPRDASEITFVETTIGGVVYSPQQQSDLFFQYVDQDDYLSSRRGQYAERNGALLPWVNQFDVRLLQDFYVNVGGKRNTLQLSLDVLNFGNLLNRDWGVRSQTNQVAILTPANSAALPNAAPTFRLNADRNQPISSSFRNNLSTSSVYQMQVGVRYIFN